MVQITLGKLVLKKRLEKGFTQEELSRRCDLDTRTIQRIEKDEVKPYFTTVKAISKALEYDFVSAINTRPWEFSEEEKRIFREKFKKRKKIRIAIFVTALTLLLGVATLFPSFRLFGISKLNWAPYFYLIMFGLIIWIAVIWRCPVCNAELGSPFNTKLCPKCGFNFL